MLSTNEVPARLTPLMLLVITFFTMETCPEELPKFMPSPVVDKPQFSITQVLILEKVEELRKKKEDRIKDLSRIPTGHPMETFDGDLVFIAKLYNSGELDQNFHFSKILKIPLKNLVSVSHAKRKIVYDQSIIEALRMYNSLYEKSFTDWFLESIRANFLPFCNFIEEHKDYRGVNSLKEEVKQMCQGMVTCYPEFFE